VSGAANQVSQDDITELTALVRRAVAGRVADRDAIDEIVQETLARLLAAKRRLDQAALGPYAIITARNLVTSQWRRTVTNSRHEHRLADAPAARHPEEDLLAQEESGAVRAALNRLQPVERRMLVAHEVDGRDTKSLAEDLRSTPGAIAAQLNRTRAKLRVEYLVEMHGEPPSPQCRPILLALSSGDRRRQSALRVGDHLIDCNFCAALSVPLLDRRSKPFAEDTVVPVRVDADIVVARQRTREIAVKTGFSATEATVIATAVSEIARNIVRFARGGEVTIAVVSDGGASGVMVVARDAGPGIPDVALAMTLGYTTYGGRGLGLPGSQRLMDEFEISSEIDRGTTVTMTKWHRP
jgi:RNA polymerase sigma factor (sigma-70 family)